MVDNKIFKPPIIGIYCIENTINNKRYIGQTKNWKNRFQKHIRELNNGEHANEHLLRAWKEYGELGFEFYILEECKKENLDEREIYWMEYYNVLNEDFGYNMKTGGIKGVITEEGRRKISEAHKGEKSVWYGKHHTDESKKKMSDSKMGISSPSKGKKRTEEQKQNMRKPKVNKAPPKSEETRRKLSISNSGPRNANYGQKRSEERKKQMSENLIGKKKTKNASSQYVGVCRRGDKWSAVFYHKHLGTFATEIEAALRWNQAAIEYGLPEEKLNKIDDKEKPDVPKN